MPSALGGPRSVAGLPRHLVLIGLSFSGKTTVGRLVAARLGLPFVDTDYEVEGVAGMSVQQLFDQQGEAAFRAIERQVVGRVLAGPPSVIATGGGAPLDEANRRALWDGNLVVFLQTDPETVITRLHAARNPTPRPLLADGDPLARVVELKAQRHHVYRQAHRIVRTDGKRPSEVAALVCQEFLARVRY